MLQVMASPERCVTSEISPPLSVLSRAYGKGETIAWVLETLENWQQQTPYRKMTPMQLTFLANTLCHDYHYLRASEIILFLARLASGAYMVDWYSQVSPDVIVKALRENFLPERERILERAEAAKAAEERAKEQGEPITWEEYCRRHGLGDRANPLEEIGIGE